MKRNSISIWLLMAGVISFMVASMSSSNLASKRPVDVEVPSCTASPKVPSSLYFAGEKIDLTRYDRHERIDREQMSFTYMHSSTLLMIKRANRYFPMVEPILKSEGVPDDFKYLMTIESSLNPFALSPVGAAGLWQFMPTTGREYGLEVNQHIDERYNIEKATRAACTYFKDAYAKYGNWITVAASYNAGFARISSQLKKQMVTNALDLWLNAETSRYMFRLLAVKEVFENPKRFGFLLKTEDLYAPIPYTTLEVNYQIDDLFQFAKQHNISYAQLKEANPWLKSSILQNKSRRTYVLHIPLKEGLTYNPQNIIPHSKTWVY